MLSISPSHQRQIHKLPHHTISWLKVQPVLIYHYHVPSVIHHLDEELCCCTAEPTGNPRSVGLTQRHALSQTTVISVGDYNRVDAGSIFGLYSNSHGIRREPALHL